MDRKDQEFPAPEAIAPPPEEFSVPPEEAEFHPPEPEKEFSSPPEASEFSPPAAEREFTPPGSGGAAPENGPRRRRRIRRLLYAASALVLTGLLFRGQIAAQIRPAAPVPTAQAEVRDPGTVSPPDAVPTPEATAEPVLPVSTPRPTPEYEPQGPAILSYFFGFSAYHQGLIKIFHSEQITSVTAEIWESNFDTLEWSYVLTEEEIASGYWELPVFDDSDTYFKYMDRYEAEGLFPALELRVTMTTDDGATTVYTEKASPEQGWSVRWWPADYEPTFDWEECYPGCFAVLSYESSEAPPDMRMGGYQDAWDNGGICIEMELNGVPVTVTNAQILTYEEPIYTVDDYGNYVETDRLYYYTTVVIPLPDGAPASGTAHFTVCQKLDGYDLVWVTNRDLEYGPA